MYATSCELNLYLLRSQLEKIPNLYGYFDWLTTFSLIPSSMVKPLFWCLIIYLASFPGSAQLYRRGLHYTMFSHPSQTPCLPYQHRSPLLSAVSGWSCVAQAGWRRPTVWYCMYCLSAPACCFGGHSSPPEPSAEESPQIICDLWWRWYVCVVWCWRKREGL